VVDALLAAQGSSLSAAKRNRLRCLKAAVLAMAQPDGPRVAAEEGADRAEATKQVGTAGLLFWGAVPLCSNVACQV